MGRCTELLTLYFPQPCLTGEEAYAEIRRVKTYKDERLSWSKGNVNLTDYWYTMVDVFMEQDMAYTCQHIDLLCDDETMWWQDQINAGRAWICLCFIKWKKNCWRSEQKEKELQQDTETRRFFRTFGNADCIYAFSAENENELKKRLAELEANRQLFFSSYFVYGCLKKVNDEGRWRLENYTVPEGGGSARHEFHGTGWSMATIRDFQEKLRTSRENKNKKMVAYYLALGQIVNIIAQYEQSSVYKNLFYIFYPPISLFRDQLASTEEDISRIQKKIQSIEDRLNQKKSPNGEDNQAAKQSVIEDQKEYGEQLAEKTKRMQKLEISMSEFIDAMETLLHHMGHSCRDILSDVGRGGIPYDVPLHLCLMYTAYLHAFTKVINDTKFQFEYCLVPLAYSRPTTRYFDFGLQPEGRLIRVQISKHMMFMPRSLLIILGHEASHYVSEKPRLRELRAKCWVNLVNLALVTCLIPDNWLDRYLDRPGFREHEPVLRDYLVSVQERACAYLHEKVNKKLQEEKDTYKYHFSVLVEKLEKIYREVLEDEDLLNWNIEYVDKKIVRQLRESNTLFQNIVFIQNKLLRRKGRIWEDSGFQGFLKAMCANFRECYADLLAIAVLDCTWEEYIEAYVISESFVPDGSVLPDEIVNRFAVVKYVLKKAGKEGWAGKDTGQPCGQADTCSEKGNESDEKGKMDQFLEKVEEQTDDYIKEYQNEESGADKDAPGQKGNDREGDAQKKDAPNEKNDDLEGNAEKKDASNDDDRKGMHLFYRVQLIEEEIKYLQACYEEIKKRVSEEEGKDGIRLVRNLYQHFLVKEQGCDSSYRDFFRDCEKLIEFYKGDVEKNLKDRTESRTEENEKKEDNSGDK